MTRNSFFDNYKAFLILCVVIGHFLTAYSQEFELAHVIKLFIYSFHMPAFVFVSGYFAHHNDFKNLFKKLLVPYFIFQIFYFILYRFIGINSGFKITPYFTLWYMVALFVWRLVWDRVKHIPNILSFSIILAVCIGFFDISERFSDIYRIFSFFPYFILGNQFNHTKFEEFKRKSYVKELAWILLIVYILVLWKTDGIVGLKFLKYSDEYVKPGLWIYHLIWIFISYFVILDIGCLIPEDACSMSIYGQHTMRTYLTHGLVFKWMDLDTQLFELVDSDIDLIIFIVLASIGSIFLSWIPVEKITDFCANSIVNRKRVV